MPKISKKAVSGPDVTAEQAISIIAGIAARQHGVIARRQATAGGLLPGQVVGAVRKGLLVPVFSGVYAVGLANLDRRGRWMAATLAAGPGAVLSHLSAAILHGLIQPRSSAIEVSRMAGGLRRRVSSASPGGRSFTVVAHRTRNLPDADVTRIDGIPVTSLARTLLDMAATESQDRVKSALSEAERLRKFSWPELTEIVGRGRGWAGVTNFRRALREWDPSEVGTRNDLEVAMLRLCRARGLSPPAVNTKVGPYLPDFLWREAGLIVEVDGFKSHGTRAAFRNDRRRDVDLQLEGFRVARFPWDAVMFDGVETAIRIEKLLNMG